jgi:hypothetical protein
VVAESFIDELAVARRKLDPFESRRAFLARQVPRAKQTSKLAAEAGRLGTALAARQQSGHLASCIAFGETYIAAQSRKYPVSKEGDVVRVCSAMVCAVIAGVM